jgi:outer membrane receptor protein involved in Fe transport
MTAPLDIQTLHGKGKVAIHADMEVREDGMNRSHLCLATALSSVLLLSVATPAAAKNAVSSQTNADSPAADIIVTARRSEERLQDVPISITVLDKETLSRRNVVSTTDLGIYVPSLSVNQQFGPEKSSFVIRGFTQSYHTAPTVGVYIRGCDCSPREWSDDFGQRRRRR